MGLSIAAIAIGATSFAAVESYESDGQRHSAHFIERADRPVQVVLAVMVDQATTLINIGIAVERGRLVVEPKARPRYTLAELLAASDYSQPQPPDEREWVDAPAAGDELL